MDRAMRAAALSDFGPGIFREGLAVLLASLADDAKLPPEGQAQTIALIERRLVNRLRIQDWYAPGLDLADPRISPLFGRTERLPPTMLHVGSPEILLDDTLRYAAKAPDARFAVWHDMPHVFPAIRGLVEGDRAIAEMADFIHVHTSAATRGA